MGSLSPVLTIIFLSVLKSRDTRVSAVKVHTIAYKEGSKSGRSSGLTARGAPSIFVNAYRKLMARLIQQKPRHSRLSHLALEIVIESDRS